METAVGLAWIVGADTEIRAERLRLKDLLSRIDLAERIQSLETEAFDREGDTPAEAQTEAVRLGSVETDVGDLLNTMREQRDQLLQQGLKRPPNVRAMAEEAGYGVGYLDFAFKSEGRTHFRILSLEPFLLDRSEGDEWLVDAAGPRTQLDDPPYETAALWLLVR